MSIDEVQWATPDLQSLVDLFFSDPARLGEFREVTTADLPDDYRELLAHQSHMTVTVEKFHGCLVDVEVEATHETPTHYARRILLHRQSDGNVVQFGIVRLNLGCLDEEVQQEIRAQRIPLGRVLIEHNVLRIVKLLSLWEINPGPVLREAFGDALGDKCYGRTALIYTNRVPAVELLEIVVA